MVVQREEVLFCQDYEREKRALASGDVTSAAVSADLVALIDADRDLRPYDGRLPNHIALPAVMGVRTEISFRLAPLDKPLPPDVDDANRLLISLPQRRPDLLAVRAGYDSQEDRVKSLCGRCLVSYERLSKDGAQVQQALVTAGRNRLRPIAMTTLTVTGSTQRCRIQ